MWAAESGKHPAGIAIRRTGGNPEEMCIRDSSQCELILKSIFFQLLLNVFRNIFSIFSYRIYIISSAPKRPVSMLVFQVSMSLVYNPATFPFQKSHNARYAQLWRYFYQHMYMIGTYLCFYYCHSFPSTYFS